MVAHHTLTLPDGRTLHVREAGDPEGPVVVYHHGTPSCGLLIDPWIADAEARGIRLLGVDRSGYGQSDPLPGRGLDDVVGDTLAVADWAGADRFRTWGVSGGGPHALACAALSGDRVIAAASVSGVTPYDAEGLDYTAGMGEENITEFALAEEGGEVFRDYIEAQRRAIVDPSGDAGADDDVLASLLCPADAAFLETATGQQVDGTMAEALAPGAQGWIDDDLVFVGPWPFDVGSIEVPVLVTHGDEDRFVPVSHAHWLAAHVRGSELVVRPGEGHLSMYGLVSDVHDWLLAH